MGLGFWRPCRRVQAVQEGQCWGNMSYLIKQQAHTPSQSRRGQTKVEGSVGTDDLRSELGAGWLTGLD